MSTADSECVDHSALAERLNIPAGSLSKLIETIASFTWIQKATVYGSRAKGTARRGSDIDIVLDGEQMVTRQLNRVCTAIDDLLLPYKMDLSLRTHIDNTALLDHIDRVGVVIYDRLDQEPRGGL